jgi:hypothetical protein
MPRKGRKQLVLVDEEQLRESREEGYRRLAIELHRAWRKDHVSLAPRQR